MTLRVNGQPLELDEGTTVTTLLAHLGAPPEGVAVAINNEVVPRREHPTRVLRPEDRVEVIRAVGGG